jgi:DNA-nicking Smr family endonuclease
MRRLKSLTDHDRATWAIYVQAVHPLSGRTRPEPPPPPQQADQPAPPEPTKPTIRTKTGLPPLVTGAHPPGLDKATWHRLRGGKLAPSRTLDLHGKTAQAAYHALQRFLHAAHADRLRCVEIITGRGAGESGVIRRELPLWLNQPEFRPLVLATAHPHAANPGAVRVLLRKPRP